MSKEARTFIKEGSAIQNLNETNHDTSNWIQDTIDKLKTFKQRVDDGHVIDKLLAFKGAIDDGRVIVKDGDYSVSRPAPDREQVTYDYISLSIDFVETKSQNQTE